MEAGTTLEVKEAGPSAGAAVEVTHMWIVVSVGRHTRRLVVSVGRHTRRRLTLVRLSIPDGQRTHNEQCGSAVHWSSLWVERVGEESEEREQHTRTTAWGMRV